MTRKPARPAPRTGAKPKPVKWATQRADAADLARSAMVGRPSPAYDIGQKEIKAGLKIESKHLRALADAAERAGVAPGAELADRLEALRHVVPLANWRIGDINTNPNEGALGETAILADTLLVQSGTCCPLVVLPFDHGSPQGMKLAANVAKLAVELCANLPTILAALRSNTGDFAAGVEAMREAAVIACAAAYDTAGAMKAIRALAPPSGDGWLPIETAPRGPDAPQIEACSISETTHGLRAIVDWDPDPEHPEQAWATADGIVYHKNAFTHWRPLRPLPAPPVARPQEGGGE